MGLPGWTIPALWITQSSFFGHGYLSESSLPSETLDMIAFAGLSAPVLYGTEFPCPEGWRMISQSQSGSHWIAQTKGGYATNIDFIASSFCGLTRYEEIVKGQCGSLSEGSLCLTAGYLRDPPVNAYSRMIGRMLPDDQEGVRPPWPDGRRFGVCLTHDVDIVSLRASLNWY